MRALADALWAYFRVKYLKDLLAGNVSFYTATVTSAPTDGEIGVQRPYDAPVTLRYAWTASSLQVGDKCTVLVFGDPSNAFVIGNGTLSDGGGGDLSDYLRIDDLAGTTGSSQTTAMTQDAVTTLAGDLQTAINDVADNAQNAIAIVADGDTHIAVSKGQYVYVKNHGTLTEGLYKATTDIAANAALSAGNLAAVSGGGLNDLAYVETVNTGVTGIFAYKCGRTVSVVFHDYKPSSSSDEPVLPQSIWPIRTVHAVVGALNNDGYGRVTIAATTGKAQPILPDYTKYYYGTISYFSQF